MHPVSTASSARGMLNETIVGFAGSMKDRTFQNL
jgi:hypothetical protein